MDEPPVEENTLTIHLGPTKIEVRQGFSHALLKQVVQTLSNVR